MAKMHPVQPLSLKEKIKILDLILLLRHPFQLLFFLSVTTAMCYTHFSTLAKYILYIWKGL